MNMKEIEKKWQAKWEKDKQSTFNKKNIDKKYYCLEMFSYPSASKLHLGHWYNYGPSDSFARYKKLKGMEVFQPMGFDAFGLPAENFAIKNNCHPSGITDESMASMEVQLKKIGAMFDWSQEIKTCKPDYYKWTQWLFLKLFENNLAYRKNAPVNWCPSCQTVLANEQVEGGLCDRCKSEVVKKDLTQWFFKITDYAEELLGKLDELDWPERTKAMQKNWIGKSTGGEIEFTVNEDISFKVFTTRADTLFGVSYVVLAPEHELVSKLVTDECKDSVTEYINNTAKVNEIERLSTSREKTGVFIGAYATNPINGKSVPIYIADYVLASYGTGAVMGVPAHDGRDFKFAKKYNLDVNPVIMSSDKNASLPYEEDGVLYNSIDFDGMTSEEARKAILSKLQTMSKGQYKVNYRLRDWLVSRQRYWGAPIPIIHCEDCGEVAVPYKDLPVELPADAVFTKDGKSPLSKDENFLNVPCPKCGKMARRESDTLDTFVCSSWYYLRYPDSKNANEPFDSEIINKMLPVDKYVGGPEHACMHLLYARFITKALRDMGYLKFDEPFKSLVHQGIILGPDGQRMSKSKGNVVSPDEYIDEFGSDVFRVYLMFGFDYISGGPWDDNGIKAIAKFFERIERIVEIATRMPINKKATISKEEKELEYAVNYAIKCVDRDMNGFSFNTVIARLMELVNSLNKYANGSFEKNGEIFKSAVSKLISLISPCAPHFAEELNLMMGSKKSIFEKGFPVVEEDKLVKAEVEVAVQINSKVKLKMIIGKDLTNQDIESLVLADEKIKELLDGKVAKKVIIIPNRLVNIIC